MLGIFKKRLCIAHDGIMYLSFVHPVAIKGRELVFPTELPFGKGLFFQGMMCLDKNQRRSGLKTHAPLNANDRVSHIDIPTNTVRLSDCLSFLNNLYRADGL